MILKFLATLSVAAVGGCCFFLLNTPLPWMLGALTFTLFGAVTHGKTCVPKQARSFCSPVLGVLIGSRFSVEIVHQLGDWFSALMLMIVFVAISSLMGFLFFHKISKQDPVTAFCSAVPAGISELMMVGPELGAKMNVVILSHLARIVVVVFAIPIAFWFFLGVEAQRKPMSLQWFSLSWGEGMVLILCGALGLLLGRRLRLPAAPLTGPLLLSAIAHIFGFSQSAPPFLLVIIIQIVVGAAIGSRFVNVNGKETKKHLFLGTIWSAVSLVLALVFAIFASWFIGYDLRVLLLGMAPGGVQEMTIIALSLGFEVAFISLLHISRISLVLGVGVPMMFRLYGSK
jgi:membrane AbrB-like protein